MMLASFTRNKKDLINAGKSREKKKTTAAEKARVAAAKSEAKIIDEKAKHIKEGKAAPPVRAPPSACELFKLSTENLVTAPAYTREAFRATASIDVALPFTIEAREDCLTSQMTTTAANGSKLEETLQAWEKAYDRYARSTISQAGRFTSCSRLRVWT